MARTSPGDSKPGQHDRLVSWVALALTAALLCAALFTCDARVPHPRTGASVASPAVAFFVPHASERPTAPSWRPEIPAPKPLASLRPEIPGTPAPLAQSASPVPPRATPPSAPPVVGRAECFRNQKLIVEAIEQYRLDKNTIVTSLSTRFLVQLRSGGYLRTVPDDPETGPDSSSHYRLAWDDHFCITCTAHGSMHGKSRGPREPTPDAELREDLGRFIERVLDRVVEADRPVAASFTRLLGVTGAPCPTGAETVRFVAGVMEPAYDRNVTQAAVFLASTPEVCVLAAAYARIRREAAADSNRLLQALERGDASTATGVVRSLQERKSSPLGRAFRKHLQELAARAGLSLKEPWR